MIKVGAEKHRAKGETKAEARVQEMMSKHKSLKELGEQHEFFEPMMAAIVRSKLRFAGKVNTSLPNLSKKEGKVIGGALISTMVTITKPESAVDEWIVGCRALKEFDKQHHVWFRPMMNTIATRVLGDVAWGLKWRVSMGAGLSVMDIISDAYMIHKYLTSEEEGQAIFGYINLIAFPDPPPKRDISRRLYQIVTFWGGVL